LEDEIMTDVRTITFDHEAAIDRVQTVGSPTHSRRQVIMAAGGLAAVLPLGGCELVQFLEGVANRPPPRPGTTGGGNSDDGSGGGQQGGGGGGYGGGY
jgi:hypothetical protein